VNDLTASIRRANHSGRLALGLYLVPGQPDWNSSLAAVREATAQGVDFLEFPIITDDNTWSARTGAVVAASLSRGLLQLSSWSAAFEEWLATAPLPVGVVYSSAWPKPGVWTADLRLRGRSTALLLERDVANWEAYADQAAHFGTCLIPAVDGCREDPVASLGPRLSRGCGLVYLSMGRRTGERSARASTLYRQLQLIREARPDLPVCCAFGIRDSVDVEEIRENVPCEGVIVGTAAIQALQSGIQDFRGWLARITRALDYSARPPSV
jgi:tryptophan synthase alpha subunit